MAMHGNVIMAFIEKVIEHSSAAQKISAFHDGNMINVSAKFLDFTFIAFALGMKHEKVKLDC